MNALQQLQRCFENYVLRPNVPMQAPMASQVVSTARAEATTRLSIYANGYRLRLLEALETDYPALRALVGDEAFYELGRSYIKAQPSRFFNLRWYGGGFAEFLRHACGDRPAWCELAVFEWAMGLAFDAADERPVRIEDVAAMPNESWPGLTFRLHASVQRLDLEWTVAEYWKAIDHKEAPQAVAQLSSPQAWLIWRKDLITYFRSLSDDEAWALDAARDGSSFAEICEGLCRWIAPEQVAMHAASLLRNWIGEELIAEIRVAS